jgi:hypothetical protein
MPGFNIENLPFFKKINEPKVKILITIAVLSVFFVFYLLQNLFFVNQLNDFDEYFIRAEMWVNGEWNWGGGPDKLLSFLEYFPINRFQHDFMEIYRFMNILLVFVLFGATTVFIIKKSDVFPGYFQKLCLSVFFLSMPFFIFQNLTLDASALLGAMLLIFFITYDNKFLGWIGLLVYLARPEGVIIVFFYILFLIIDKNHRKSILINFITFIVLFIGYKYIESKYILHGLAITGSSGQDASAVSSVENHYLKFVADAAISIIYIPVYLVLYGMEILQNKILFFFYIIGLAVSVFNKRMWAFFVLAGGYAFLYLALNQFHNPFEIGDAFKIFGAKMKWFNDTIAVANGRNPEFEVYGHTRYRVFLYPAVAAFVIAGVVFTINFINSKLNRSKPEIQKVVLKKGKRQIHVDKKSDNKTIVQKNKNSLFNFFDMNPELKFILSVVVGIFLLMNYITYRGFSVDYTLKSQMNSQWMNDYYKLGFDIRKKMKPNDAVFMPNICNCNRGFFGEFMIFSGTRFTLIPVCEKCDDQLVVNHPEQHKTITASEIEKQIPSRLVFFDRYGVDYKKSFNSVPKRQINTLYQKFDLTMLDSLKVHFIISTQTLTKPGLVMLNKINDLILYENLPALQIKSENQSK